MSGVLSPGIELPTIRGPYFRRPPARLVDQLQPSCWKLYLVGVGPGASARDAAFRDHTMRPGHTRSVTPTYARVKFGTGRRQADHISALADEGRYGHWCRGLPQGALEHRCAPPSTPVTSSPLRAAKDTCTLAGRHGHARTLRLTVPAAYAPRAPTGRPSRHRSHGKGLARRIPTRWPTAAALKGTRPWHPLSQRSAKRPST